MLGLREPIDKSYHNMFNITQVKPVLLKLFIRDHNIRMFNTIKSPAYSKYNALLALDDTIC